MAITPADCEEIRNLTARYNFGIDLGDADAVADTFTSDGIFHVDSPLYSDQHPMGGRPEGRDELVAYYGRCFDMLQGMMRHMNNGTALIEGGGDTATSRSYMFSLKCGWGDDPAELLGSGIYFDKLKKVDGKWRFSERRWVSDPQPEHRGNQFHPDAGPDLEP